MTMVGSVRTNKQECVKLPAVSQAKTQRRAKVLPVKQMYRGKW